MSKQSDSGHLETTAQRATETFKLKTINSRDLFDGARELRIEHNGALYRLKITRQDKLILNK